MVEDIIIKLAVANEDGLADDIGEWKVTRENHDGDADRAFVVIETAEGTSYICKLSSQDADARLVVEECDLEALDAELAAQS